MSDRRRSTPSAVTGTVLGSTVLGSTVLGSTVLGSTVLGTLAAVPTAAQEALDPLPNREVLLDLIVNLGVGGIAVGFAILHALIYFFYSREKGNLFFSLFALGLALNGGLDALARYGRFGPKTNVFLETGSSMAAGFLFIFLVVFLSNVVSPRPPRWIWAFTAAASVIVLSTVWPPLGLLFAPLYLAFIVWCAFLAVWFPVRALWLGIEGAWALGLSGSGWVLFFTSEAMKQYLNLSLAAQAVGFGSGALLILLGFSIFLARRIARAGHELEELNISLEQRVGERTAELARSEERERRANQAKSEFLANMSHEIRTPMNAVIGLAELLATSEPDPKNRRLAETIHSSAHSLLAILDDILDFSKVESGQVELERTAFAVEACVADAVELFAAHAAQKAVEIRHSVEGEIPPILGDPTRVRQVLVNLIGNAVKFTAQGSVEVTVMSGAVMSGAADTGELYEVRFAVRDTGIGIPEQRLASIFNPFTQVDNSVARRFGGTGLGLAISKRLVESMGGRLWAESEPGVGSTFHFTICAPTAPKEDLVSGEARPETAEHEETGLRVLLAEDNVVNQKVTCLMLERLGWEADVVADGLGAVAAVEAEAVGPEPYDVVLMDVRMPGVDGIEACRRIRRSIPPESGPYVVALTASALAGDRERCYDAGMDDFVSKPVTIEALSTALAKARAAIRDREPDLVD